MKTVLKQSQSDADAQLTSDLRPLTSGSRGGFTLLEMMVVMIIAALLIAMLGGAYLQARNHAKRARAEAQLRELVKAWNEYYLTYTNWPSTVMSVNGGVDVPMSHDTLMPLFAARDDGSQNTTDNPRGIPFLSINIQPGADYKDPWGNTYKISFRTQAVSHESALRISVGFPNRDRYRE